MMRDDLIGTLDKIWRKHGDIVRLRYSPTFHSYLIVHPDHMRHVMQTNSYNYTRMPTPMGHVMRLLVGNGLLMSDGAFWLRQRRLAQPAFHRKRIAEFGRIMTTATVNMLDGWHEGMSIDMEAEMKRLTLEIVGKALLSIDLGERSQQVDHALRYFGRDIVDVALSPAGYHAINDPDLPATRRINGLVAELDEIVEYVIAERRKDPDTDHGDLLSMFMQAVDEESGASMDDQQLRDELMSTIVAGHETSATALTWIFYQLTQYPEVYLKLKNEIDTVLDGRVPTMADYRNLQYTQCVINETMRLFPPAYSVSRYVQEADKIGGYDIEAGTTLTLGFYFLHRHPDFWENPERYDPDRFSAERSKNRHRHAFLPFGTGPRQCIGNTFSMTELTLVVATMIQRFRYELAAGYVATKDPHIALGIANGLPMQIAPLTEDVNSDYATFLI